MFYLSSAALKLIRSSQNLVNSRTCEYKNVPFMLLFILFWKLTYSSLCHFLSDSIGPNAARPNFLCDKWESDAPQWNLINQDGALFGWEARSIDRCRAVTPSVCTGGTCLGGNSGNDQLNLSNFLCCQMKGPLNVWVVLEFGYWWFGR